MCSHHLIEPVACTPGAGWEKGQVERQVGDLRGRLFARSPRGRSYAEFTRLVKRHAANSISREPGCVAFEVSVDRDDPRRFIFYEIYLTEADFDAHTQTPWFKRQMERTGHMVDGEFEMFALGHRIAAPNK